MQYAVDCSNPSVHKSGAQLIISLCMYFGGCNRTFPKIVLHMCTDVGLEQRWKMLPESELRLRSNLVKLVLLYFITFTSNFRKSGISRKHSYKQIN